ncbi:DUF47 domain-containing protein [bacterium]|nr:DUF47 domain-containing protein [bacterium]
MVFSKMLPHNDSFYDYFIDQAKYGREAGAALLEMVNDFDNCKHHLEVINALERHGDEIVAHTLTEINKSFITPLDREDIHALCSCLDDILDYAQSAAQKMVLFRVAEPTQHAKELCQVVKDITEQIFQAITKLKKMEDCSEIRLAVTKLEKEGDRINRNGVAELFNNVSTVEGVVELIRWREIYSGLETVTDKCEDIMDIIEGIYIKYA